MKRQDDFATRRAHLADLTNQELKDRFWELTQKVVDPLLKLGYENTSPAIERSVLLRMGFSSLEVKDIVQRALEHGLLGHGAGNVVYKLSTSKDMTIRQAGLALAEGRHWECVKKMFGSESA